MTRREARTARVYAYSCQELSGSLDRRPEGQDIEPVDRLVDPRLGDPAGRHEAGDRLDELRRRGPGHRRVWLANSSRSLPASSASATASSRVVAGRDRLGAEVVGDDRAGPPQPAAKQAVDDATDSDAGTPGSIVSLTMWPVMTASGRPRRSASRTARARPRSRCRSRRRDRSRVLALALPRPGKCLIAARTPSSCRPVDLGLGHARPRPPGRPRSCDRARRSPGSSG